MICLKNTLPDKYFEKQKISHAKASLALMSMAMNHRIVAYLYNWTDSPGRRRKKVRMILNNQYQNGRMSEAITVTADKWVPGIFLHSVLSGLSGILIPVYAGKPTHWKVHQYSWKWENIYRYGLKQNPKTFMSKV